jgi:hypothetical protein
MQLLWEEKAVGESSWHRVAILMNPLQPQSFNTEGEMVLAGLGGPMLAVAEPRRVVENRRTVRRFMLIGLLVRCAK